MASNARNKFIKIRATANEIAEVKKRAGATDMSTYLRQLALGQPIAPPPQVQRKVTHSADPELVREVNRIGININQIAKHTNEGRPLSNAVLIALLNLQASLDDAIKRTMPDDR